MQAYIIRPELQKFQRRAWKAYAKRKEYIEAMFGLIHNGVIVVSMFYPVPHTADIRSCSFVGDPQQDAYVDEDTFDDLRAAAKDHGLKLIGTIHSHPGYSTCRHLSHQDERHIMANCFDELLTGTIHLFQKDGRKVARTQFSCLWEPVQVKFVTSKGHLRNR